MARKQVWPHGESYRGPMSVYKSKKLALPMDLSKFLIAAMKKFRTRDVAITIHAVEPVQESIWETLASLEMPDRSDGTG